MGDPTIYDHFRSRRQRQQEKKAQRRESAPDMLREQRIPFTEHNGGAHLRVLGPAGIIDFWPGPAKWVCPSGKRGMQIQNLIDYIKESNMCDITNEHRASRAAQTLDAYECFDGADPASSIRDLLADMMHYCHQNDIDFGYEYRMAKIHFDAEKEED